MDISFEILNSEFAKAYRQLRLTSYQESPFAFSESYEDEVKKPLSSFEHELMEEGNPPEQFILGVFDKNDKLIGFVKFRRDKRSKARHKSMMHAMYIQSQYRQKGIGRVLVIELLKMAQRIEGLEQIHLWVLHSDKTAARFYESCGFISQGPVVKKDLKIGDAYIDTEYMVLYFEEKQGVI